MARPGPEIILSVPTDDAGGVMEILESQGVWVLTHAGRPVALREKFYEIDGLHVKYPRTGYNNEAHCVRLAEKLNKQFNTKDFSCLEVVRYIGNKAHTRRLTSE